MKGSKPFVSGLYRIDIVKVDRNNQTNNRLNWFNTILDVTNVISGKNQYMNGRFWNYNKI